MRFLHTSDWHLGQKLLYFDREEEHRLALDWLLQTIVDQQVEVLVVAGDIFDIGNAPNYARRLYYGFLYRLLKTSCRHVVITGGNHDSPGMLEAPKDLLQILNVHVVGAAPARRGEEILELRSPSGALEAVVAAAPFLRDRDLRTGVAGETAGERVERLREGIRRYYQELGEKALRYQADHVPILATGHLYARGAETSDRQDNIYIGDRENIDATDFPEVFAYVALGHLHRAQIVGNLPHVRYSGSLIPLSFSETKDEKGVFLVDFQGPKLLETRFLPAPVFRRLKTVDGDLETVRRRLRTFDGREERLLRPWVEVIVHSDAFIPQLDVQLREFTAEMNLDLLKVRLERIAYNGQEDGGDAELADLKDLEAIEVFVKKCENFGSPPEQMDELLATFRELQAWMTETTEQ